jgi:2-hydroxy-3-keto-5-methylthiopentenyl-1-phosphate phosphatase
LHLYIDPLVPPDVPVFAYDVRYDGRWRLSLPTGVTLAPGEDLKTQVLGELRARHPGGAAVYVGDGRLDFEAARRCDRVFAVRGSTLARLCRQASVPCTAIDTFHDVIAALETSEPQISR